MTFVAELCFDQQVISILKSNGEDTIKKTFLNKGDKFYHIKITKSASNVDKREVENTFWEGLAINTSTNNCMVYVWTDPIGLMPIYYRIKTNSKKVVISDNPKFLIENTLSRTDPDNVGFWQALAFETPLRNKTILKNIYQLGSGEKMSISKNGEIIISKYWKWDINDNYFSSLSFEKCVDIACELFDQNMRQLQLDEKKLLLPLSGGYDSRLIAILAARHLRKDKIYPVTYSYSKISRDYIYANQICKSLSLSGHQFHRLSSHSYVQALDWMVKETGGFMSFSNAHLLDYLRSSNGIEGILSSGFSDALCGFESQSETKLSYSTWEKSNMVQRWKSFSNDFKISRNIDDETMNDLEILSKAWYDSNITSFDEYLYIIERHAKFHLPLLNLWRKYSPVINPFISSDLIKLFFSMPPKFRFNKILEKGVIKNLSPDVANIKSMSSLVIYGRTGNKVDRFFNRGINFTNMILRSIGFANLEISSPRITEQLCKAMHTLLKTDYTRSVSQLYDLDIYNSQQEKKMRKISLRVDKKLSFQLHALNCAATYRLKR